MDIVDGVEVLGVVAVVDVEDVFPCEVEENVKKDIAKIKTKTAPTANLLIFI